MRAKPQAPPHPWLRDSAAVKVSVRASRTLYRAFKQGAQASDYSAVFQGSWRQPRVLGPVVAASAAVASVLDVFARTPLTGGDWLVRSYLCVAGIMLARCTRSWTELFQDSVVVRVCSSTLKML